MRIITENQIIVQKDGANMDQFWSPADGKLKGKIKGLVGSGKVQGVLAALGNNNKDTSSSPSVSPTGPSPTPSKPKMSTTKKVLIGVGIVAFLGAAYYFLVHKKKGQKK